MVLIVGPGAMGLLLAARLARAGVEVVLLDRDAARAARLEAAGIELEGQGRVPVQVRADPTGLAPELVLLCVKAPDTPGALAALGGVPGTVLVLQNGLGRASEVGRRLGDPSRVVGGTTAEGATLLGEGRVRHAGSGPTRLAPLVREGHTRAEAAAALLRRAGLEVAAEDDLPRLEWEKLVVNAAINALTGLLGCPNGALLRSPAARGMAQAAAEETGAVARALGVAGDWSPEAIRRRWEGVAAATAANHSSTLQDLRRGRMTEVHAINGAVAQAAQELDLAAPVNGALDRLVAALEELACPNKTPTT